MPASPRHALKVLPALLLSLGLLLVGCAQDTTETPDAAPSATEAPRVLEPGTCWTDAQLVDTLTEEEFAEYVERYAGGDPARAESLRDDAAFTDEVACAEPHALELYAAVELPPRLDRRVTEYADLLDQESPLYDRVRDAVNQACLAESAYGRAERRAGDLTVQLAPALSEDGGLRLAWDPYPAELWEEGERRFTCTLEQDEPSELVFADLATSAVPVAARSCLNTPGRAVPCNRPHQAEEIGEMTLNAAVDAGQIDAERAVRNGPEGRYVALSDPEYAQLDRVCARLFRAVSTGREDVEAQAFPGGLDQWPTRDGDYVASCFALKAFDPPPKFRGTVFDR